MVCSSTTTDFLYLQSKSRKEAQARHDVFAFFIDGVAFAGLYKKKRYTAQGLLYLH